MTCYSISKVEELEGLHNVPDRLSRTPLTSINYELCLTNIFDSCSYLFQLITSISCLIHHWLEIARDLECNLKPGISGLEYNPTIQRYNATMIGSLICKELIPWGRKRGSGKLGYDLIAWPEIIISWRCLYQFLFMWHEDNNPIMEKFWYRSASLWSQGVTV